MRPTIYTNYLTDSAQTAYTVELTVFRRLLALGAALLRVFFLTRAAPRPSAPVAVTDTVLASHDRRSIAYYSIFGKLTFARHYFYTMGAGGQCPLDAALSLPEHCYSDLLREWTGYDATDGAYRETASTVERILGLDLSIQALERSVREDAQDVAAFSDQPPAPHPPTPPITIVVAQADGKGVPMVQPPAATTPLRLGKGQKRTKKKEAIVTALYTIAPYVRTPQEVLAALLHDEAPLARGDRPRPVAKELRATLDGKEAAVTKLARRAALREGPPVRDRVALTDGAEALQEQMLRKTIGYYQRNLAYMRYDVYLARGWPIGTGVVEGACGHVVKERMEQAGMRWTSEGAQAMLDLRTVRINGDWELYWQFHRQQQHHRLYGTSQQVPERLETQVLPLAA